MTDEMSLDTAVRILNHNGYLKQFGPWKAVFACHSKAVCDGAELRSIEAIALAKFFEWEEEKGRVEPLARRISLGVLMKLEDGPLSHEELTGFIAEILAAKQSATKAVIAALANDAGDKHQYRDLPANHVFIGNDVTYGDILDAAVEQGIDE